LYVTTGDPQEILRTIFHGERDDLKERKTGFGQSSKLNDDDEYNFVDYT
jgi:hypothetical protein